MDKLTSSLSPNKRTPTHQLKKHVSSKNGSKGRKEDKISTSNMLSIQLLKPPIKNNMQSLFQPNQSKSGMNDCPTPTMSTLNNVRDFSAKDSSIDRSINSNNRCSTQERVLKMADESLRQISNQLESSQRTSQSNHVEDKVTSSSQQSMAHGS